MNERYFTPSTGGIWTPVCMCDGVWHPVQSGAVVYEPAGRWTASRCIDGRWVALIENMPLFELDDASVVLLALGIPATNESMDQYFPMGRGGIRCPTLALMELFAALPPGKGAAVGV